MRVDHALHDRHAQPAARPAAGPEEAVEEARRVLRAEPRPVAFVPSGDYGAAVTLLTSGGRQLDRVVSLADGSYIAFAPSPGTHLLAVTAARMVPARGG